MGLTVVLSEPVVDGAKASDSIPTGTLFTGKVGNCAGLFLKAHGCIVSLSDPTCTWAAPVSVDYYKEVNGQIIITPTVTLFPPEVCDGRDGKKVAAIRRLRDALVRVASVRSRAA